MAAAADLVGTASAALNRAVEHAKTRRQFGTPIGAFQGIKHALADNYVGLERARSLTYAAAARLDDPTTTPAEAWTTAALAVPTRSAAAATNGAVNARSVSTGAVTNGSASTSTSASGCAGSVDSPGMTDTPSAQRTTATTVRSGAVSARASVTSSSARDRLGTATARPRKRPARSVIGAPGSRDPLVCTASVATTPPAMSSRTASRPAPRNAPAARPTLLNSGIGAMAAPHSSSTTASSTGP
nr:acyl-CoA dehydrogenase family protein [Mycobacterium scrofulaceum]